MTQRSKPKRRGGAEKAVPPHRQLTGWKLWRLRLLSALVIPSICLVLVELILRLAGIGYPTGFLLRSTNHGQKTLVQNNQFGWRFFGRRKSRTPCPISILAEKPANTIRIFVFGESAAFGDPQPAFGLPRMLEAMLSLRYPEKKFEVVNAAMTAINSHVILPIARDCAHADGDIWVIYMGNNEFVGPFGASTVFGAQAPRLPLVRATVALKSTYLGQSIDGAREGWQDASAGDKSEWGGMAMFSNYRVPAGDPRVARVYSSFEKNLSDIIDIGRRHGAGVVVSTVAVNLKDCAPFASQPNKTLAEQDHRKCEDLLRAGIADQLTGQFAEAINAFETALKIDDTQADLHFLLGRCLLATGDALRARQELVRARDLDSLRFRCDSHLNSEIRKVASHREGERVLLADAEQSFAAASRDGLPGQNLFYEHVHFTFEGNYLLAKTIADQIDKLLPKNLTGNSRDWPSMEACARRLGWTGYDLRLAITEVLGRLTEPPFTSQANHAEQVQFLISEAKAIGSNAGPALALTAVHDAINAAPHDAGLYEKMASLEDVVGNNVEAEQSIKRALDLLPSSAEDWSQLGHSLVEEKNYPAALDAYRWSFNLNRTDVSPLQNWAMCLVKLGRNEDAIKQYKRALAITPRFGLAWLGLGQVYESMGRKPDAENCYRKALENRIHRAPELATLARFCMARGWYQAAATNYDAAMSLDPINSSLALEAGRAHFSLGAEFGSAKQPAAAAVEFREAARLMPGIIEPRLNLGIALYRAGNRQESAGEFQQVLEISPTNQLARQYLNLLAAQKDKPTGN